MLRGRSMLRGRGMLRGHSMRRAVAHAGGMARLSGSAAPQHPAPLLRPSAGKLWRLKEAGLWNLEPTGYFEEGRYLSFTPPKVPRPLPPAAIEPYAECVARHERGEASAQYDGWWAPAQPAPCVKPIKLYADKNGDQGMTISEARTVAPRLQAPRTAHPRDCRTALHGTRTAHARHTYSTRHTHASRTAHARTAHARRTLAGAGAPQDGGALPGGAARRHGCRVAAQPHLRLPHVRVHVRPLGVA